LSDISEKGSDFLRGSGQMPRAKETPYLPALIGMGVLWLFTGSRPVERAEEIVRRTARFDRIPDAAGNAFEAARSTFRSGADSIGEHVTSAKDALRGGGRDALDSATRFGRDYADAGSDYARSIAGAGAEMFDAVRSNLTELFRTQPLALGAIGFAIRCGDWQPPCLRVKLKRLISAKPAIQLKRRPPSSSLNKPLVRRRLQKADGRRH